MSTRDLINAIQSGDSIAVQSAFEASMAQRVAARLDTMRQEVAQNMFKEQVEEIEEELNLEDYSLEEIEDFMMSEDFEQLDELKKSTLTSYVNKARNDKEDKTNMWTSVPAGATPELKKRANKAFHQTKQREKGMKLAQDKMSTAKVRATEETELGEAANKIGDNHLHVQEVKHEGKTKYKVHAVGKNFADGIKAGEHLSDTELDDFQEMGGKVKHVK